MASDSPLVTILIATKDRPAELKHTLRQLRGLTYPAIEMLVIDDGSAAPVEPVVRSIWPEAVCVREEESAGQSQRRTEGFTLSQGKYILQLDDDSYPVSPDALDRAVSFLERNPHIGALAFHIFNGVDLPEVSPVVDARYVPSFVGCGVLFRNEVLQRTGGYQWFMHSQGEEEELALRILKQGSALRFYPEVLIHHHLSPQNRHSATAWMRGLRNKLWSLIMHHPLRRLPFEMSWTLAVAIWDALRLVRPHYLARGLCEFFLGLPRALRLREPMSPQTLKLYDALRWRGVYTEEEFRNPPPCSLADIWRWYRTAWRNRPRQRSWWDRQPGDTGSSLTVRFAHEEMTQRPISTSKEVRHP